MLGVVAMKMLELPVRDRLTDITISLNPEHISAIGPGSSDETCVVISGVQTYAVQLTRQKVQQMWEEATLERGRVTL
jgi:hypothetical protein